MLWFSDGVFSLKKHIGHVAVYFLVKNRLNQPFFVLMKNDDKDKYYFGDFYIRYTKVTLCLFHVFLTNPISFQTHLHSVPNNTLNS